MKIIDFGFNKINGGSIWVNICHASTKLKSKDKKLKKQINYEILKGIDKALEAINEYRTDEGLVLENDFLERSKTISKLLEEVIALDPERIDGVKERLRKAVADLKEKVE